MTILRFKNPTNMYRIDAKKQGGERVYPALEDLWIKSRFSRSNMSIREVGWSGEKKNPRRNKRKNARRRSAGWVKCRCLGAIHYGAELGASHSGAEPLVGHFPVPRTSAPVTVAPSSAPVTLAPSQGSISGILSARGLFERNFRKKGQIVKNSANSYTNLTAAIFLF